MRRATRDAAYLSRRQFVQTGLSVGAAALLSGWTPRASVRAQAPPAALVPLPPGRSAQLSTEPITSATAERVADLATLAGHIDSIWSVAVTPDGQLVASGSSDRTVRLWRTGDGALLHTLTGHTRTVFGVAFSPDGQLVASGGSLQDETVRLWRVDDGTPVGAPLRHRDGVTSVAFSPDGQAVAAGSLDGTVQLWQVADGTPLVTLARHERGVHSVAFSPDGQMLASGSEGQNPHDTRGADNVRLWRVADGRPLRTLLGHRRGVHSVAFSPDGQLLASASPDDGTVRLWRPADGVTVGQLHILGCRSVAFSPDGEVLAVGLSGRRVQLWRVADRALLQTLVGHTDEVSSVAFSTDGRLLASGSWDDTVRLWAVG